MIKPEANAVFFKSHQRQSELASALDEAFDVTHGSFFNNQAFWLCDPKPQTSERFGFSQELIALYSPHAKADARLITSLGHLLEQADQRARADRVVSLIVYEGDDVSIEALLNRDPDRILVPISAAELADRNRAPLFVRAKIAERVGQFDLFGMSSPIQHDRYFYGRQALVQELVSRAVVRREQSGLFGLRKTGKTSVLFAVQRRLESTEALCEYIDCQSPGVYGGRWWHVINEILERLVTAANNRHGSIKFSYVEYHSAKAANEFNRVIKEILKEEAIAQVVLLLDEVEFITPNISNALGSHWDVDFQPFWQTIRATSQELSGRLSFIVAGVNPTSVEEPSFEGGANPIFQLAVPYYLEPLPEQSVRDMVRTIGKYCGAVFEERCYSYLETMYGGHPYLIRLACSEVVRSKGPVGPSNKIQVGLDDLKRQRADIKARLAQPIRDILLSLVWWYPDEYEYLRILADDKDFAQDFLKEVPHLAGRFNKYGLLGNNASNFLIADMKDFLVERGVEYKNAISPFRRSNVPLDALPSVPNIDDLGVLFEKRTSIEIGLRKLILMMFSIMLAFDNAAISRKIVAGLKRGGSGHNPADLFVGRLPQDAINELYLIDLKPLYIANWATFTPYFGTKPDRFEMNLDTINIARRVDSHAKPFSDSERDNFLNSYSWFENILKKIPGIVD